ncbi:hypothetical protein FA09DRAFT_329235 [Tilletiopsis washingtonensis]|uniref:Uncharacterized protein n=1 Tax=Tilletiopsis washingtonensis TaxID=58919 RepID=A0A316ZAX4_9BASI|nr:hypothetical protein FA09DRAFT_329235 [Tilletiopsis washingtonensis]PWN98731.1 hypothetical protein FA09DRAFT_329235 [Tilletiopsis washingtonensis]
MSPASDCVLTSTRPIGLLRLLHLGLPLRAAATVDSDAVGLPARAKSKPHAALESSAALCMSMPHGVATHPPPA